MAWPAGLSLGADIKILPSCEASGFVVRLADVAEIYPEQDEDVTQLGRREICPAPIGGSRFLNVRDIRDALQRQGVNLGEHAFTGANKIEIHAKRAARPSVPNKKNTGPSLAAERRATALVIQAIAEQVDEQHGTPGAWDVEVTLDPKMIQLISASDDIVSMTGPDAPWEGETPLSIEVVNGDTSNTFQVQAVVQPKTKVVVAKRTLNAGTILHPGDVELVSIPDQSTVQDGFETVAAIVGKEVARGIPQGQPLTASNVRSRRLVKKGEVVTVYATAAGLRVKTTGRARDEGGAGDVITVETLQDRQPMFARVTGPQEVEVQASSTVAESEPTDATASEVPQARQPSKSAKGSPRKRSRARKSRDRGDSRVEELTANNPLREQGANR